MDIIALIKSGEGGDNANGIYLKQGLMAAMICGFNRWTYHREFSLHNPDWNRYVGRVNWSQVQILAGPLYKSGSYMEVTTFIRPKIYPRSSL